MFAYFLRGLHLSELDELQTLIFASFLRGLHLSELDGLGAG